MFQPSNIIEDIGASSLLRKGAPLTDQDKIDLVNQATLADVQAAAKRVAGSKLSLSAVGNLGNSNKLKRLSEHSRFSTQIFQVTSLIWILCKLQTVCVLNLSFRG